MSSISWRRGCVHVWSFVVRGHCIVHYIIIISFSIVIDVGGVGGS